MEEPTRMSLQQARDTSPILRAATPEATGAIGGIGMFASGGLALAAFTTGWGLALAVTFTIIATLCALASITWLVLDPVRHNPRADRFAERRAARANRHLPWRPLEGEAHPKGRDDTYDRALVEVVLEGSAFAVGVAEWTLYGDRWTKRTRTTIERVERDADGSRLGEARATAEIARDERQAQMIDEWNVLQAQQRTREQQRAIEQEIAAEATAREARDARLAAQLSD